MAKLIYTSLTSLDGYIEDADGKFDWAAPDEEVHAFVNEAERPVGTYLYGRRVYDTMKFWESEGTSEEFRAVSRDYAEIWRAAEKIVFSRSLEAPSSTRTRIERNFVPAEIEHLKQSSTRDLSIGGAELAGQAIAAGLVDEIHLFKSPIIVGCGKLALPSGVRTKLELMDEQRFRNGVVYLHYAVSG